MLKWFANSLLCIAAMTASAQQVALVSSSEMQFTDPSFGVTFRYPAKWNFAAEDQFYMIPTILEPGTTARGTVFFNPYPKTNLIGAEFSYTNRSSISEKACVALLSEHDDNAKPQPAVTIHNTVFTRVKTENAGCVTRRRKICTPLIATRPATCSSLRCTLFAPESSTARAKLPAASSRKPMPAWRKFSPA